MVYTAAQGLPDPRDPVAAGHPVTDQAPSPTSPSTTDPTEAIGTDDYDTFYTDTIHWLVGRARLLARDLDDAWDLAQEAMIGTWKQWATVRGYPAGRQRAYVNRAMINNYYSRGRRQKTRQANQPRLWSRERPDSVETEVLAAMELDRAWTFIHSLPEAQRVVLILTLDGWSSQEIADTLGCSPSSVRSSLKAARDKVVNHLDRSGGEGR